MRAFIFSSHLPQLHQYGFGLYRGYFRFTFQSISRWKLTSETPGFRVLPNIDNYGGLLRGCHFRPLLAIGSLAEFRRYRGTATHLSIGPITISFVNDSSKTGPIGAVKGIR